MFAYQLVDAWGRLGAMAVRGKDFAGVSLELSKFSCHFILSDSYLKLDM